MAVPELFRVVAEIAMLPSRDSPPRLVRCGAAALERASVGQGELHRQNAVNCPVTSRVPPATIKPVVIVSPGVVVSVFPVATMTGL